MVHSPNPERLSNQVLSLLILNEIPLKRILPNFLINYMSDNLKFWQPQDKNVINVHDEWKVEYWKNMPGVARTQFFAVVRAVANSTKKLKKLGKEGCRIIKPSVHPRLGLNCFSSEQNLEGYIFNWPW